MPGAPLLARLKQHNIRGSILIASEGINGTISGERADIDTVLGYIKENIVHAEFAHKESIAEKQPFGARQGADLKKKPYRWACRQSIAQNR